MKSTTTKWIRWAASATLLVSFAGGCGTGGDPPPEHRQEPSLVCTGGEVYDGDGIHACLYRGELIEEGFSCPMPDLVAIGLAEAAGTLCLGGGSGPENVPDAITEWLEGKSLQIQPPMPPGATTITFELVNDGAAPIYVDATWGDNSHATLFVDGAAVGWDLGCNCACDANGKPVVGCSGCLPQSRADTDAIAPGTKKTFTWDGTYFAEPSAGAGCFAPTTAGTSFEVEFCWSETVSGSPDNPPSQIDAPTCQKVLFDPATDTLVRHEVASDAPLPTTDFVLRNGQATDSIWVDTTYPTAFITVTRNGQPILPTDFCLCPCEGAGPIEQCAVCAAPLPATEELAPGAEQRFSWEGRYWVESSYMGLRCFDELPANDGASYSVDICWGTGNSSPDDGFSNYLTGETCQSFPFDPMVGGEVVHEVTAP